jgi:hypothetical protein
MEVVAGLTLKNLRPAVWNPARAEHTRRLRAVMLSFDEFRHRPTLDQAARRGGILRSVLGLGDGQYPPRVFLDNGAFACLRRGDEPDVAAFCQFVEATRPAWYPVPADYIPLPSQSRRRQRTLFQNTIRIARQYVPLGFRPVIHPGPWLHAYIEELLGQHSPAELAVGGLVPHLLNSKGAQRKATIRMLCKVRSAFRGKIHAFGLGGVVTLHLGAALGVDSADSSGWRQRAARGLIILRGRGERQAVKLGKWKGRELTRDEWQELERCRCPACRLGGSTSRLCLEGIAGFAARATHNLTVLLDEAELVNRHLAAGNFTTWSLRRIGSNALADLVRLALDEAN